jgi:hypothetical protein
MNLKIKRFGVRFSGHGSRFLPESPICNKTFQEAQKEAVSWELIADTIGGKSEIVEDIGDGEYKLYHSGYHF